MSFFWPLAAAAKYYAQGALTQGDMAEERCTELSPRGFNACMTRFYNSARGGGVLSLASYISTIVCQLINNSQMASRHVGQCHGAAADFSAAAEGESAKRKEEMEKWAVQTNVAESAKQDL